MVYFLDFIVKSIVTCFILRVHRVNRSHQLFFLNTFLDIILTLTILFLARSEIDFLATLPDRVRGSPLMTSTCLNAAMGPIMSLTMRTTSFLTSCSDFVAPTK